MSSSAIETGTIKTKIPSRLDRLPWSRFHWLIVLGLGTAWILDGLEVTIVGSVASRLTESGSGITITTAQIGTAGAIYVVGACSGALVFGQLTDRLGRKKLFLLTLGLYLVATAATAGAFNAWYFFIARFFTGAGIGGEYAAINSAIDELIPARARGRIDLIINGSFWLGSIFGSAASIGLLNTAWLPKDVGWRIAFVIGVILAIAVMLVRRNVPESPRWLFIHGREQEAEAIVGDIENGVEEQTGQSLSPVTRELTVRQRKAIPFREIARVGFKTYPKRSILALALFVGQAFLYNGITFNLGTLMSTFFKVSSAAVPLFIILYAAANFLGPLSIGRLFDTIGRRVMISFTYLGSAALGAALAWLFAGGALNRWTFIGFVMGTFFLASAGASAAYLTASEIFPMETRALAIAFFYAIGTAVGGVSGPLLFGHLIGSGKAGNVAIAFWIGSGVMALGGVTELAFGVAAERQQLEDIAKPLTVEDAESEGAPHDGQDAGAGQKPGPSPDEVASGIRAQAAEQRAHATDHLVAMHQQLAVARAGDETAAAAAESERVLAEIDDLTAQALDHEAAAAEEQRAAGDSDGQSPRTAAEHRANAAQARARALRIQAEALAPDYAGDGTRHRELARACEERALAEEQWAEAAMADHQDGASGGSDDGEVSSATRRMHEAWAEAHEAWADAHAARARASEADREVGPDRGADKESEQKAEAALERARAAEAAVRAAEYRAEARQEGQASEPEEAAQREREERAREERIRARLALQHEHQRGLRRLRPGPGRMVGGSPAISSAAPPPPELLDHEISAIARVLEERGPLPSAEISRLVGGRYWGPGVFRRALAEAVADGSARRIGHNLYAVSESAGVSQDTGRS